MFEHNYLFIKDKDMKDRRNQIIADMWLACYSENEIAEVVGCDQATIHRQCEELCKMDKWGKCITFANYQEPDWSPEVYAIWNFAKSTNEVKHLSRGRLQTYTER